MLLESRENQAVRLSVQADLQLIEFYDRVINDLENYILKRANGCRQREMRILQSIPGVGIITALTILLELDTVERFGRRQDFVSYSRLVKCTKESAGKKYGTTGKKMGNPYLKWAFSEAAVHMAEYCEPVNRYLKRLESKHGKGQAKSLLAHKVGRAVYHMLQQATVFDEANFLSHTSRTKVALAS